MNLLDNLNEQQLAAVTLPDQPALILAGEMIFEARDVPYRSQLVPLAAIHVALGAAAEAIGKVEKIRRWYWSSSCHRS